MALADPATDLSDPRSAAEVLALNLRNNLVVYNLTFNDHPSDLDILDARLGDCTDMAALFASMARSLNIPVREVAFLLRDAADSKRGHVFTEVYVDGEWVHADPTWSDFDDADSYIRMAKKRFLVETRPGTVEYDRLLTLKYSVGLISPLRGQVITHDLDDGDEAEKQIYEAFQACDFDGRVLYEVRPLPTAPQLDFAVWIVGVGIFGIQVKGGRYILVEGQWFLITDRGRSLRESPVPGTWDAAMAIRDVVQEQLHQSIFVIPVLAMPNMEPNQDIEALAGSRNVAMHWGDPSQMVDHLVQLAIDRKVYITPTPASIAAQVQLVEPGLVLPRQAPAGLEAPQELHIHVEHLHIHIPQGLSELQGTPD